MFSNYYTLVKKLTSLHKKNRSKGFKEYNTKNKKMKTSKAFNYRFSSNYFNILSLTYQ